VPLSELIRQHGYWITFAGAVFEGETILNLAGLAAHRGYLRVPAVIALGALGGLLGDQLFFLVGRLGGSRVWGRFPRLRPAADRVTGMVERRPVATVLAVRFLYGLHTAGPIAIGMSGMPWATFAAVNAVGALTWSTVWITVGYLLGGALETVTGDLEGIEHWVFAAIALLGVVAVVWRRRLRAMAAGLAR
jgi:membrane protein DedA with SNARE-associated domain